MIVFAAAVRFQDFALHQQTVVWVTFGTAATTLVVRVVSAVTTRSRTHRALHVAVAAIAALYCTAYMVLVFGGWSQPEWASVTRWFAPLVWVVLGVAPVFASARIGRAIEERAISRAVAVIAGDDEGGT